MRVSLGGVRDESEIRGHRRTYIGAMPGRVIGAMKQAGTINPLILLDEIDRLLVGELRGDPAAALLEVLDPEQNKNFTDHFLDVTYDLSKVLFITAQPPTISDKSPARCATGWRSSKSVRTPKTRSMSRRYLLRRQLQAHGLAKGAVEIPGETLNRNIHDYAQAGVRQLDREIATICRKVARDIVRGKVTKVRLTEQRLEEYLGPNRYGHDLQIGGPAQVGLAIGLGTTEIGGELIPVEVATMPGRGNLTITGQAGDVMQESAQARALVRSLTHRATQDRSRFPREDRPPHPPAGGRAAQGRSVPQESRWRRPSSQRSPSGRCATIRR